MRDPSSSPRDLTAQAVRRDVRAAAVLIAFGLWIVTIALRIPLGVPTDSLGPRAFPVALGAGIAICGVLLASGALLFRGTLQRVRLPGEPDADDDGTAGAGSFSPARLIGAIAVTGGYLAVFEPLGYLLATPVYVLAIMLLHGGAPPRSLAITPPLVTVVLYAVFRFGLLIPIPEGILEPLLRR